MSAKKPRVPFRRRVLAELRRRGGTAWSLAHRVRPSPGAQGLGQVAAAVLRVLLDFERRGLAERANALGEPVWRAVPRSKRPPPGTQEATTVTHPLRLSDTLSLPLEFVTCTQAILDTVLMLDVRGITPGRDCVARWLDLHPDTGSHKGNVARLRAEGYLDGFTLTTQGRQAARVQPTGLDAALAALPDDPKRRMLRAIVD